MFDIMIDWFTDNLVRALSLLTPSKFSDEALVEKIAKLRALSRSELIKNGVDVIEIEGEAKKKRELISYKGRRLYPHESSEMRADMLVFKFRFDDIAKPDGDLYANILIEIDADGKVVKTESSL